MVGGIGPGRGPLYVALGFLRMGWISNFLSKAVLGGFILGFALGIVFQQLAKLLGVDAGTATTPSSCSRR